MLIGTAIVGDVVRLGAGPGITLSFLLSGLACVLAALCYAEFAAMIPVSGSAYTYSYATLGEFIAWITGWNLILEYGVASVAVAIGWSGYFNKLLEIAGIHLPHWATHAPGGPDGGIINLPAMIIVLLCTWVLVVGIKESARVTTIIVVIKLAVIGFFIAVGVDQVDTANWTPYMPNGFAGVGAAAAIVFFAYIGFDAVSTTAEEARQSAARYPDRHHRLAGHLHTALPGCCGNPDRHDPVAGDRRERTDCRRTRPAGLQVGRCNRLGGRSRRHHQRAAWYC